MTDQQAGSVADTPASEPSNEAVKKTGRAGRNLPAAIAVGVGLGGSVIAILLFAPKVWVGVVAVAMAVATHEVVRRLREGGYSVPVVPLLIGGQAMVWLTWPFGPAGALGGFGGIGRCFGSAAAVVLVWAVDFEFVRAMAAPAAAGGNWGGFGEGRDGIIPANFAAWFWPKYPSKSMT